MLTIKTDNIDSCLVEMCTILYNSDNTQTNLKGQSMKYEDNVSIRINSPMDRHLNVVGRNNNIFAMIAETMWVLSGSDKISPWLVRFLPRAPEFSDDGKTWRGAYGDRIYSHNQLEDVVSILSNDPNSRQAYISIADPSRDSIDAIKKTTGGGTKDLPCNQLINFAIKDGKLNITVSQRSADIIWGLGSINIFEWTVLQEIVASILGLPVGYYTHNIINMHYYLENPQVSNSSVAAKQVSAVIEHDRTYTAQAKSTYLGIHSDLRVLEMRELFETLIDGSIEEGSYPTVLRAHGIYEGLIYDYCKVVQSYLTGTPYTNKCEDSKFVAAIFNSKFRKFEII